MKFFPLVLANLGRHKRRVLLTIASVALALFLFASLRTVVTTLARAAQFGSARRLVVTNATGLVFPLPLAYANRLKADQGITAVTWANWFGGRYGDGKRFFAQFAVDPASYLAMYPEITAAGRPEAGLPPGALLGHHRPPAARRVRLEAGPERHHPGHHLSGRLDLHHPRGVHPVRCRDQRRHAAVPSRVPGGAHRAAGPRRLVRPGDRRPQQHRRRQQDGRRPVPELQRSRPRPARSRPSTPASPPCGAT